jgi:hypothetical protein
MVLSTFHNFGHFLHSKYNTKLVHKVKEAMADGNYYLTANSYSTDLYHLDCRIRELLMLNLLKFHVKDSFWEM